MKWSIIIIFGFKLFWCRTVFSDGKYSAFIPTIINMEELKIDELDLYELLGVEVSSDVAQIKKAYRKKALQCHPDKNLDNPNAGKEFRQLTAILEILTDAAARLAYDKVLKARKDAALRNKELDGKRRKLKEDLERREKLSSHGIAANEKSAAEKLKEEIERLRKEGSKAVEEEVEAVYKEMEKQRGEEQRDDGKYRIKVKWTAEKNDVTNGGYSQETLHKFFSKYGDVTAVVVSAKKRGSALVEFSTKRAAEMAVSLELGILSNPLKLEWVNKGVSSPNSCPSSTIKDSDYESVILTKMRQAEERKRLIAEMMAEDSKHE